MSRSAKVRAPWAAGKDDFALTVELLDELEVLSHPDEPALRVGPGYMLGQFSAGVYANWKPRWVPAIIRLGLIGGGMKPSRAQKLVDRYVAGEFAEHIPVCIEILTAAIAGGDDDLGESAGETTGTSSPSDVSPSSSSTDGAESSANPSDASPSGRSTRRSRATSKPTAATPAPD